jgi:uncharacterized protein YndB with AHSA1/START domain
MTATANRIQLTIRSDHEVVMTRIFEAPRDLLFKIMTDPESIPHWWGRHGSTMVVDKMDLRPGGAWRFVEHAADGSQHAFRGEYGEIVPPERVAQTFEYEGVPGHIVRETMTLEDLGDNRTRVTVVSLFDSVEDRDNLLKSGMEVGANETWNRLEAYAQTRLAQA